MKSRREISSRAQQVKNLFLASLQRPPEERSRFIQTACANDALLESEVKSLLRSYKENENRLESSVLDISAASLALKVLHESDQKFTGDIGRYRIVRQIGRGGMGVVYEGARIDGEYEQRVAIKLIGSGPDSEFVSRRFRKERQILANLNHPNIARLLDGGTTADGLPYLVMEYVDGLPIDKYADEKSLTTIQRLELFRSICSAVDYAHRSFVIHRDIKPTNILVNEEGVPKLLDFGIAKLLLPESSKNRASQTTTVLVMTPEYSSPEQVRGSGITNATDVYSLGVVLYKLLTGCLPYQFKTNRLNEVARLISTQEPEKPSTAINAIARVSSDSKRRRISAPESVAGAGDANSGSLRKVLRGDLDNITLMALRKEPERRYKSVEQFSEDIRRYLNGLPIIARKDTLAYSSTKFFKRNRTLVASSLVVAFVCLLLGSLFTLFSVRAKPKTSVAILPFVNSGDDPNLDYLCDGITEKLLNDFSHIPGLKVAGRDSVFRYKGSTTNPGPIATGLGVETVLTGRVTIVGSEVLVDVALSEGRNSQSIFNKQYRGKSSDIQTTEEEIAHDVADKLGWKLGDQQHRQLRGTQSAEAYDLYLKGNYCWNQRNPEALDKAAKYYKRAVEIDPNFALAYSGLANSYSLGGAYLIFTPEESFGKAKEFASRAIESDPTLAEAHTSMALIRWLYDWDWDAADREFKRAIELNPNYPLAHHWYGLFLGEMNHPDAAIAEEQRALQLDPLSIPIVSDLGRVYFFARRYDESEQTYLKAGDRLMGAHMGDFDANLGELYEQTGKKDKLIELRNPFRELQLALVRGGMPAYWHEQLARVKRSSPPAWRSWGIWNIPYARAVFLARLGENERALDNLELAYKTHIHLMTQLKVNPAFDGLRSDPRFLKLLRQMNLDEN